MYWENSTLLEKFKMFLFEKYFMFGQSFVNTYYALAHLTLGIEPPMEDEEHDGNSTEEKTGDNSDQGTSDDDTGHVDGHQVDDTGHVGKEGTARDQETGQGEGDGHSTQGEEPDKQEL